MPISSKDGENIESPTDSVKNQIMNSPNECNDIEHAYVHDDPRKWSPARKTVCLIIVSFASMLSGFANGTYIPTIGQIKSDFHAADTEVASTLSIFILVQGITPLFWSAISEAWGRKVAYVASELVFIAGSIIVANARNINIVIAMRCLQAFGSSSVLSVGAGTLADIYDPHERGQMMGIYYAAPLLGPSLGPIIGGALTNKFTWRSTFYFMAALAGMSLVSFILFKDTFRRERSTIYQLALARHRAKNECIRVGDKGTLEMQLPNVISKRPSKESSILEDGENSKEYPENNRNQKNKIVGPSLRDINPLSPVPGIIRRRNNFVILIASGLFFAFSFSISYTCARTVSIKYHYDVLQVGLVLLSYGLGSSMGSVIGGRWSDRVLRILRERAGGHGTPEMRLNSTKLALFLLPFTSIIYGWLCEKHVHIAAVCVALFFSGFMLIWIYSSTLAYIVDVNVGCSSSAVACNGCFRGILAFVAAQVAPPLQNSIGDGWLYTVWGLLLALSSGLIALVIWKGKDWRERDSQMDEKQLTT